LGGVLHDRDDSLELIRVELSGTGVSASHGGKGVTRRRMRDM
jgi:hypothetical protein